MRGVPTARSTRPQPGRSLTHLRRGPRQEQSSDYGIAPGTSGWTTLTLPPGCYELICNIAGHYGAGMYAVLDVTGPPK